MKDRLIELICDCDIVIPYFAEKIADHLLANGVIVPPCKVGQTIYVTTSWVSEYKVKEIAFDDLLMRFYCENEDYALDCRSFIFFDERIGKTVFLTREEAEQALKERVQP